MLLDAGCELMEKQELRLYTDAEMCRLIADADAMILGLETIDRRMLDLAKRLKIIARFGVGTDNIDLNYAKERGVFVTNCAGVNARAVAELAVMLMIAALRHLPDGYEQIQSGNWFWPPRHELGGKTVGLLGCGAIARNVAKMLRGFDVTLLAYDVVRHPDAEKLGIAYCGMDELLRQSDIVSVHLPLMPATARIMNEENISKMKDGAVVINTARGGLIDEDAMTAALESGKLGFFAADVLSCEPAVPSMPILRAPNTMFTPHIAAETHENFSQSGILTAQAVLDALAGRVPGNLVNG